MKDFKLAVFDIAGTTVRDENFVAIALDKALIAHGHEVQISSLIAVMGLAKPVAIGSVLNLISSAPEVLAIHRTFRDEMIRFYTEDPRVEPIEGVESLFESLRSADIRIALDTGFDREITNVILTRLGWNQNIIEDSITSDEVPRGRPYADMILELMRRANIDAPAQVIKAGDTVSDIREGRAANCGLVIGVLSGSDKLETLESENPDLILSRLSELDLSALDAQATKRE